MAEVESDDSKDSRQDNGSSADSFVSIEEPDESVRGSISTKEILAQKIVMATNVKITRSNGMLRIIYLYSYNRVIFCILSTFVFYNEDHRQKLDRKFNSNLYKYSLIIQRKSVIRTSLGVVECSYNIT